MSYRLLDHTADLAIEVTASSRSGLFEEAAAGFTECLVERAEIVERARRALSVSAANDELLIVEWLAELLHAFESEGFLTRRAEVTLSDDEPPALRAVLHGETYDPGRHALRVLIKGVTYHALRVTRGEAGWTARVVFDI